MEQVIRSFLPWEAIAKKYFSEDDDVPQSASLPVHIQHAPEEPVKKAGSVPTQVKFEDDVPEPESESDSESGSESGDDGRGELKVSEEVAEIEFEDMDKPEEPKKDVVEKEVDDDPLKEIEKKAGDTLVLNM
jgi:hypothetical protein